MQVTQDLHADSWQIDASHVGFECEHAWSIAMRTLHGGKQEGVKLITIDNGRLKIVVVPTRGMNVLEVRDGGVRLGWDSPVQEIVHPQYINLESRGGLGWLEGFNEWLARCGLEFAGHPGVDEFISNTGDKAEMMLTLHGKIANTPASEVAVVVDDKPPYRIRVRGIVHERLFFGPKLQLSSEISTEPGACHFRIEDVISNQSAYRQEYQIIYHTNFGTPLLGAGARLLTPARRVTPMNQHAARAIQHYDLYAGPTDGFIEEVYLFEPLADSDGHSHAVLQNAAGDYAASIRWATGTLPCFTVWKNTAAVQDGYVTGLEPGTGFPFNRKVERQAGRVPQLGPGETRRITLDFNTHRGRPAVRKMRRLVEQIQAGGTIEISEQPPGLS